MDRATYPEVVRPCPNPIRASAHASTWAGSPVDASLFGLALRGVCLAATCHHARRCALTLSPAKGAAPFHPSPATAPPVPEGTKCFARWVVFFLLHLSSSAPGFFERR